MQLKAKTNLAESSCKQLHPGSQAYLGLLVPINIMFCHFCGTNCRSAIWI